MGSGGPKGRVASKKMGPLKQKVLAADIQLPSLLLSSVSLGSQSRVAQLSWGPGSGGFPEAPQGAWAGAAGAVSAARKAIFLGFWCLKKALVLRTASWRFIGTPYKLF